MKKYIVSSDSSANEQSIRYKLEIEMDELPDKKFYNLYNSFNGKGYSIVSRSQVERLPDMFSVTDILSRDYYSPKDKYLLLNQKTGYIASFTDTDSPYYPSVDYDELIDNMISSSEKSGLNAIDSLVDQLRKKD